MKKFRKKNPKEREEDINTYLEQDKIITQNLKALNMLDSDEKLDVASLLQGEHQKLSSV